MHITVENQGDIRIVRVEGRLDATSVPVLEKQLSHLIDANHKKILADFEKVDYLSSAGMRLLLSVTKKLKSHGGKLAICAMNDDVMEIIKMAGFERIMNIYPTEKEALAALEG